MTNSNDLISSDISIKVFTFQGNHPFEYYLKRGRYLLEVWGAQGGNPLTGGEGGYSRGILKLSTGRKVYIYCGEKGSYGNSQFNRSFPDGGANFNGERNPPSGSGGGSTDIRFSESLDSRIIVAGDGGGAGSWEADNVQIGGFGGGSVGGDGSSSISHPGIGASNSDPTDFIFGEGTNATGDHYSGGGGGGGYYGGKGAYESGGGGGSGYVSKILYSAYTIGGNNAFDQPDGTRTTGHLGHGFARITCVSITCALSIKIKYKMVCILYFVFIK